MTIPFGAQHQRKRRNKEEPKTRKISLLADEMDEEVEQQLTGHLSSSSGQQLGSANQLQAASPVNQRRSLASILSIKREPRRPKTPSVVVTDETTHLVSAPLTPPSPLFLLLLFLFVFPVRVDVNSGRKRQR